MGNNNSNTVTAENAVAMAILEKSMWMRFGLMFVRVRPLTLAQILDISAAVGNIDNINLDESELAVTYMLENTKTLEQCQNVITYIVFRSPLKRILFGWYIRRHTTMARYEMLLKHAFATFNAGFFLTSITILKGLKTVSAPTNTRAATVLGASSEE